jgi:hypothetical protein
LTKQGGDGPTHENTFSFQPRPLVTADLFLGRLMKILKPGCIPFGKGVKTRIKEPLPGEEQNFSPEFIIAWDEYC